MRTYEDQCDQFLAKISPDHIDLWMLLDLMNRRISELESTVRSLDHKIYGDPYD